jgi:pyruvate,orthophosphate dikinase
MQVRAIFEAACQAARARVPTVHPEVMIPLVGHWRELEVQQQTLELEAEKVMSEQGRRVSYVKIGTMIEIPRRLPDGRSDRASRQTSSPSAPTTSPR